MIQIFYGPKAVFEEKLPVDLVKTTLVELARKSDTRRREHIHHVDGQERSNDFAKKERIECLVSYSDEYAGLSDHAIQSFISFLDGFEIENIFLQNPPNYIVSQLDKSRTEVLISEYQYERIDIDKLSNIAAKYEQRIIGQNNVKRQLVSSLYPMAKGRMNKPCVMLFYGPTGVGKTETAKFLSETLGEKLLRRQFSMFHNNTFADYLFGSEHSKNSFAKDLLERESNIILLDEFDKPNPVFFSAFYQLFDEGIFEDKNYIVNVKHAIFICTSNFLSEDDIRQQLGDPIFSRFDAIIKFESLSQEGIREIIKIEFAKQTSNLDEDEKHIIENNDILEKLLSRANILRNARHIKKVTREIIYGLLGNELLKSNN